MWNLPFTLEQVIFIPLKQMQRNLDFDSYYDNRMKVYDILDILQEKSIISKKCLKHIDDRTLNLLITKFKEIFHDTYSTEKIFNFCVYYTDKNEKIVTDLLFHIQNVVSKRKNCVIRNR